MERFIRYLYEYENEKRIRNVGFIKVEEGCEETSMHIQAKGFHGSDERKLKLYLFFEENGDMLRISRGETTLNSPVLNWNHVYSVNDIGGEKVYSKICGVLIETGSGRKMATSWDDRKFDVNKMKTFEGWAEEKAEQREEDDHQASQKKYTKITRQDISKLPRCEWKLANNQFLIYGYNNYHHLLLIDDGNYLKLGVPGIYHIKEEKCADAFGFGEFLSVSELGLEEIEDEVFGYWCRTVKRQRNQLTIKETDSGDDNR